MSTPLSLSSSTSSLLPMSSPVQASVSVSFRSLVTGGFTLNEEYTTTLSRKNNNTTTTYTTTGQWQSENLVVVLEDSVDHSNHITHDKKDNDYNDNNNSTNNYKTLIDDSLSVNSTKADTDISRKHRPSIIWSSRFRSSSSVSSLGSVISTKERNSRWDKSKSKSFTDNNNAVIESIGIIDVVDIEIPTNVTKSNCNNINNKNSTKIQNTHKHQRTRLDDTSHNNQPCLTYETKSSEISDKPNSWRRTISKEDRFNVSTLSDVLVNTCNTNDNNKLVRQDDTAVHTESVDTSKSLIKGTTVDNATYPTDTCTSTSNCNNEIIITEQWLGGELSKFDPIEELHGIRQIWNQLTSDEQTTIRTTDTTIPIRHYRAEKQNISKAIEQIKRTLQWRKEFGVDDLKKCWGTINQITDTTTQHLYECMGLENATGKIYVRGYDQDGRALMYMTPAWENRQFNLEYNMKHLVWNFEKAIACTRRRSFELTGRCLDKINLLIDYDGFILSKHAPPLSITKYTLDILQKHYPERMYHAYLLSPPPVFRIFWSCIKNFVDANTKEKIIFCSGTDGIKLLTNTVTETHKLEVRSGYIPITSHCEESNRSTSSNHTDLRPFHSPTYQSLPIDVSFDEDN